MTRLVFPPPVALDIGSPSDDDTIAICDAMLVQLLQANPPGSAIAVDVRAVTEGPRLVFEYVAMSPRAARYLRGSP